MSRFLKWLKNEETTIASGSVEQLAFKKRKKNCNFKPGMTVNDDTIGKDPNRKCPYKIKDEQDAREHAKRFMKIMK